MVGEGQYAGDKASAWISAFIEKPGCQLYYMTKPRHVSHDEIWGSVAKPEDKVQTNEHNNKQLNKQVND